MKNNLTLERIAEAKIFVGFCLKQDDPMFYDLLVVHETIRDALAYVEEQKTTRPEIRLLLKEKSQ